MAENRNIGKVTQIIGPVLDVEFKRGRVPKIYSALLIESKKVGSKEMITITCEVQQLLGDNRVRAVAMSSTDGLKRGTEVTDTGLPISVPVGQPTLGRIFNVLILYDGDGLESIVNNCFVFQNYFFPTEITTWSNKQPTTWQSE